MAWQINAESKLDESDLAVHLDSQDRKKVINLVQDICTTVAYIQFPKQIAIALHILKQIRSRDTVTLSNRFGNCISYQDTQRYVATIAQVTNNDTDETKPMMQSNIRDGLVIKCSIDNWDFHDETSVGTNLHGTSHIICSIQLIIIMY